MLGGYCNVGGLIFIMYAEIPELTKKKLPKYVVKYKKKIESIANILDIIGPITGCLPVWNNNDVSFYIHQPCKKDLDDG